MAAADPFAELLVTLTCPACSHEWSAVLDPVEFVWERLERWARHLGDDVHVLASAYGWSEADILALTPQRRRLYLEAVARMTYLARLVARRAASSTVACTLASRAATRPEASRTSRWSMPRRLVWPRISRATGRRRPPRCPASPRPMPARS